MSNVWHVGVNALLLTTDDTYRSAGVSTYIGQLLQELPPAAPDFTWTAFVTNRLDPPPVGFGVARPGWATDSPWARIVWEQTGLALAARQRRLDLLHGTVYANPLLAPCRTVVTVHDLSFVHFPTTVRRFNRFYLRAVTRLAARRAVRVIADSESTRRELLAWLGLSAAKVVTVPIAADERFRPAAADAVDAFRRQRGLPARFALFLGTLEPRKNLVRLLDAYAVCRTRLAEDLPLVIAGSRGWYYDEIFARVRRLDLQDAVHFAGFVPAAELPWWYRAADIFVYPSLYEGFGLPVLEAMASGTAVITSNTSSLPEVAGDAAILVDPSDVEALAEALVRVLNDPELRLAMSVAGVRQAAKFSWRRCAEETVAVYHEALGLSGPTPQVPA